APPPGADPFHPAIAELSARVRAATSPESWRRWVDLHLPASWGSLWVSTQRSLDLAPTFDGYLLPRRGFGASPPPLAMVQIVAELQLPEQERERPLLRTATEVAWLLLCLDDGLYSYPKENWRAERAGRDAAAEPAGIPILMREHHIGVD